MTELAISIKNLQKSFKRTAGTTVAAVDGISLDVEAGQMVAVVGPSGCGKTTLLRCVAGLERPTAGQIWIGGRSVFNADTGQSVAPEHRAVGMMFQSYALWPHMSVFQNVAYPLEMRRVPKREIGQAVAAVLERVRLTGLKDELPNRLSGGQQQRLALARCLVGAPSVILLDEPLSNVDAKVREELRLELVTMQKELKFTGLYVTHDQDDAMQVCDRLVVLREGRVEQTGAPADVYRNPSSCYVAEFIGVVNKLTGRLAGSDPSTGPLVQVQTELGAVAVRPEMIQGGSDDLAVLVRPHLIELSATPHPDAANCWSGTVSAKMFMGARVQYVVAIGSTLLRVWTLVDTFETGAPVWATICPDSILVRANDAGGSA